MREGVVSERTPTKRREEKMGITTGNHKRKEQEE